MNMLITVDNETIDDSLIMLDLEDFEEDELNILANVLSDKRASDNNEAFYKIKEYAENCGVELKIK